MGSARPTRDPTAIRRIAEELGLVPWEVAPDRSNAGPAELILAPKTHRPVFTDLTEITWDHFFVTLDRDGLAVVFAADGLVEVVQVNTNAPHEPGG